MSTDLNEKISRLKSFSQQDPDNAVILGDLFDAFLQSGSFEEGIHYFSNLQSTAKNDPMVSYKVGNLALAAGDYPVAEQCFTNTLSQHPGNPAILFNVAYSQYYQHRFDDCVSHLQQIGEAWKEIPDAQLLLARGLHHLGNIDEAIEAVNKFLTINSDHSEALGLLSLLYLDAGDDAKAQEIANTALESDENQLEAMIAKSSSAISLHDPETAKASIDHALEKHGHVGRLWSNKGQLDMLSLDLEGAKKSLSKAVELMPNHIGTWHLLAWCQMMTSQYQEALNSFEKALELNRNFGDSHGGIAVTLVLLDRLDEANDAMRRAVKLDPGSMAGQYAKSLLLEKQGKKQEAEAVMKKIMDSSSSKDAMNFLPMIQFLQNK